MYYIDIEIGGRVRKLKYDYNAIADLEERAGMGIGRLFDEDNIGLHTIRLIIWAGLRHEERGLTTDRVGKMIQEYIEGGGDLEDLVGKAVEALEKCEFLSKNPKAGAV